MAGILALVQAGFLSVYPWDKEYIQMMWTAALKIPSAKPSELETSSLSPYRINPAIHHRLEPYTFITVSPYLAPPLATLRH
jgi:hypothetical protein